MKVYNNFLRFIAKCKDDKRFDPVDQRLRNDVVNDDGEDEEMVNCGTEDTAAPKFIFDLYCEDKEE